MNTSSFLSTLRENAEAPLVFRAGSEIVHPGYHLTEVKRVAYETMDCGGMMHRWAETHFEIWVPAVAQRETGRGHMAAAKFLKIIDRVEAELPLNGNTTARIHASFDGKPAALYDIESVKAHDGTLWIELRADRTRCKAAERRLASTTGGCCGSDVDAAEAKETTACGCGSPQKEETHVACCA